MVGRHGYTNARSDHQCMTRDVNRVCQTVDQMLGNRHELRFTLGVAHDDREFITPRASHLKGKCVQRIVAWRPRIFSRYGADLCRTGLYSRCNLFKNFITALVANRVVDPLEMIDIDHD